MPGVFPDYPAPVVRNVGTQRELVLMRAPRDEAKALQRPRPE
jgi:hypothetical protein